MQIKDIQAIEGRKKEPRSSNVAQEVKTHNSNKKT